MKVEQIKTRKVRSKKKLTIIGENTLWSQQPLTKTAKAIIESCPKPEKP